MSLDMPGYHITQLANLKGFQQDLQLLQHEADDKLPPKPSDPLQLNAKSAAWSSKADSELVVGSTPPIGKVLRELFIYWCLHLHSFIFSDMLKGKVPWVISARRFTIYCLS